MRIAKHMMAGLLVLLAAACSMSGSTVQAEAQVSGFHQVLDQGDFETIYNTAGTDLRQNISREDFLQFLELIHSKLGSVRTSAKARWNVSYTSHGQYVTLVYNTRFAHGDAVEQFVYKISSHEAILAGYHINFNPKLLR